MLCRERKKKLNCSPSIISMPSPEERGSSTSIPHLFRCPISLDLFTDPVTLSTGQTYDRSSIERWLSTGNLTCPVSMQKLADPSLVPNHTLRHLIDQWLLYRNPSFDFSGSFSLATLKQNLHSPTEETLLKIRTLATESEVGQSCLVQSGFLPLLLDLLIKNPELAELALDCILSLRPSRQESSLSMIKDQSSVSSLASLLERGHGKIRISLCYLLDTASSSSELCLVLGQNQQLIKRLAALLYDNCTAEAAVRAVSGLCSPEANRDCAINSGVVDGLVAYLTYSRRKNATKALMTLDVLMGTEIGVEAFLKNGNSVRVVVRRVFCVSAGGEGGEHAVRALLRACRVSAQARQEAVNGRAMTQLLLLLQSQCSAKAKRRAGDLLKLLSSAWIEDPAAYDKLV